MMRYGIVPLIRPKPDFRVNWETLTVWLLTINSLLHRDSLCRRYTKDKKMFLNRNGSGQNYRPSCRRRILSGWLNRLICKYNISDPDVRCSKKQIVSFSTTG